MIQKTLTAMIVCAAFSVPAFATCDGDCDGDGADLSAKWKGTFEAFTSAVGPAGTEVLIGNLQDVSAQIKVGEVLDAKQQTLGTTMFEGVLGADGLPNVVTTGLAGRLEGDFKIKVDGGELCLTECAPPPAE